MRSPTTTLSSVPSGSTTRRTPKPPKTDKQTKQQATAGRIEKATTDHGRKYGSERGRGRGRGRGARGPLRTLEEVMNFFALDEEDEGQEGQKVESEKCEEESESEDAGQKTKNETKPMNLDTFLKERGDMLQGEERSVAVAVADQFPPCGYFPSSKNPEKKYSFPRWTRGKKGKPAPEMRFGGVPTPLNGFKEKKNKRNTEIQNRKKKNAPLSKQEKKVKERANSNDWLIFTTISHQLSSTKLISDPEQLKDFIKQHFGLLSLESKKPEKQNENENENEGEELQLQLESKQQSKPKETFSEKICTCSSMVHRPSLCIMSTLQGSLGEKGSVLVVTTFQADNASSKKTTESRATEHESEEVEFDSVSKKEKDKNKDKSESESKTKSKSKSGHVSLHYKTETEDAQLPDTLLNLFSCPLISKVWAQKKVPWQTLHLCGIESWNISFIRSNFIYASFSKHDDNGSGADFIKFYFPEDTENGKRYLRIGVRILYLVKHILGEEMEVNGDSSIQATQEHTLILFFLALSFGLCLPAWPIDESKSFDEDSQKQFQIIAKNLVNLTNSKLSYPKITKKP